MSKKFLSPIKLAQGASNPAVGSAGELFFNTTDVKVYAHNGTTWVPSGGGVTVSATAPSTPIAGDAWYDTVDGTLYVYYNDGDSSQWVEVAANSGISVALSGRLGVVETYVTTLQSEMDAVEARATSLETSVRSVALGGTGASSHTSGAYLKGAGTSAVTSQVGIPKADLPAGTILQVATWRETSPFTSTATAFTSLLAVSITPRSTSSQMYIVCTLNGTFTGADSGRRNIMSFFRDSTNISNANAPSTRSPAMGGFLTQSAASQYQTITITALDSPATTSAISYSIRTRMESGDTLYINRVGSESDSALYPRGVSTITVFEVQG